ncbi:MAG: invasion associated locus B family protein [Methyloceanibacter sp.]
MAFWLVLPFNLEAFAQADGAGATVAKPAPGEAAKSQAPKTEGAGSAQPEAPPGPGPAATPPAASIAGNFGEWVMVCATEKDDSGKMPCSLAQALVEQETQKLVFRVIFTHGPKGNLVLQIDGPIGVALQRGLEFSPDTKKVYRLPFQTCIPRGCRAVMVVDDGLKEELKASKQGSLTVYALSGQAVRTNTDLAGLTEGLAALDERRAPAPKTTKK